MNDNIKNGADINMIMERGPATSPGSLLHTINGHRQVKAYVLTEDNLDSLSVLDSIFNICLAIGSALLSFAGGIYLSLSLANSSVAADIKAPWTAFFSVCLAFGLICVFVCFWSFFKRKGSIQRIKEETKHASG